MHTYSIFNNLIYFNLISKGITYWQQLKRCYSLFQDDDTNAVFLQVMNQ